MITRIHTHCLIRIAMVAVLLSLSLNSFTSVQGVQGQTEPRREELLNGLHVLISSQPANPNVTILLRIHSGAAFDLAGKSGAMALLGDQLFPDPETHDFFIEELGGSLQVTVDYDAVNISMTGRASEFERMVEILRTALISTPITVGNVARLREARIKMNREMSVAPSFVADRAIARRLFGDYPYGRTIGGTAETLARVDRVDLMLARERFHAPDNSTLVIIGGVQESRALRASRQLLGAWRKSDKLVPATFRMPDEPDTKTLIVDMPFADSVDLRLAVRSLARSDRDYLAATLLTKLVHDRWRTALPELDRSLFFVRNESFLLMGMFVMGVSVRTTETSKALETAKNSLRFFVDSPVSAEEIERVRSEVVAGANKEANEPARLAAMWLDIASYKLPSGSDQMRSLSRITAADVQRVAIRLFRDTAMASVVVGNASIVKPDLERAVKVEVSGESRETMPPVPAIPAKSP